MMSASYELGRPLAVMTTPKSGVPAGSVMDFDQPLVFASFTSLPVSPWATSAERNYPLALTSV